MRIRTRPGSSAEADGTQVKNAPTMLLWGRQELARLNLALAPLAAHLLKQHDPHGEVRRLAARGGFEQRTGH
eukprot:11155996-Lingulodinium_polyedra.AAC.1